MREGGRRPAPFSRFLVRHPRGEANPRRISFREPDVLFGHSRPLVSLLAAASARTRTWEHATLYVFLAPFALLTALFGIWPIAESIRVAFTDSYTALSDSPAYVGLDNFRAVLAESAFHSSLWRTLAYTFLSVMLNVSMAIGLAILLAHPDCLAVVPFSSWRSFCQSSRRMSQASSSGNGCSIRISVW